MLVPNEQEESKIRTSILSDYVAATERYAGAVRELKRQSSASPFNRYSDLYQLVEDARNECERLRRVLFELGGDIGSPS